MNWRINGHDGEKFTCINIYLRKYLVGKTYFEDFFYDDEFPSPMWIWANCSRNDKQLMIYRFFPKYLCSLSPLLAVLELETVSFISGILGKYNAQQIDRGFQKIALINFCFFLPGEAQYTWHFSYFIDQHRKILGKDDFFAL
jgi:hypothetical protein